MIGKIIFQGDIAALTDQLAAKPELANRAIRQGENSPHQVHPIHLVCDAVFEKKIEEKTGLEMVRQLVAAGSDVNGRNTETTSLDSPLITAGSLYCDTIAVYLIDQGADPTPRGTHNGTALHWASWTGSVRVVERLLKEEVAINDQGDEFRSTPLLWAINGWLNPNPGNHRDQPKVIALLLEAGANPNLVDGSGRRALDILATEKQSDLVALLKGYGNSSR